MIVASQTRNVASPSSRRSPRPSPHSLLKNGPLLLKASGFPATARYHLACVPTAWGTCGIVWKLVDSPTESFPTGFIEKSTHALLSRIITPGLPQAELRKLLLSQYPQCNEVLGDREGNFHPEVVPEWFPELARCLRAYYTNAVCNGVGSDLTNTWNMWRLRLDWSSLTQFQRAVLDATAAIPRGRRLTYGEIAKKIHKPRASRAVGAALGSNPWPVLVPCHRVVGANGSMTGFSAPGGVEVKRRMLEMEQLA